MVPHIRLSWEYTCFIPLLQNSQRMWVWQEWVMRFFDFNLSQPHKHRLTLISVLNAPHCKVLESGPCFSFFPPLPLSCLLPHCLSATYCPSFVMSKKRRLDKLMAARRWAAVSACAIIRNVREPASSSHFVSFDNILKEVNNTRA